MIQTWLQNELGLFWCTTVSQMESQANSADEGKANSAQLSAKWAHQLVHYCSCQAAHINYKPNPATWAKQESNKNKSLNTMLCNIQLAILYLPKAIAQKQTKDSKEPP